MTYSEEAEKQLIGSLLSDNKNIFLVDISAEMFFNIKLGKIYDHLKKQGVGDIMTVSQYCDDNKINVALHELAELSANVIGGGHVEKYADIIRNKYIRREATREANVFIEKASNESVDVYESLSCFIEDFTSITSDAEKNEIDDMLKTSNDYVTEYAERHAKRISGVSVGYDTGYEAIEIEPGQACLIAALPKQGKSMLAANLAMNVSRESKVIFFSFEMTKEEIMHRLLSIHAGKDIDDFRKNRLTVQEASDAIASFYDKYKNLKIYDKAITIEEVEQICKREKVRNGIDFIVLDYIQRTPTKTKMDLVQKTIHNSSKFKNIILNLKIGGLALSQFTRESAKRDFPSSNDLFGGEAMKQDFDQINILHNGSLDVEKETKEYDPVYVLRKTHDRNGGTLGDSLVKRINKKASFTTEKYKMPKWLD